MSSKLTIYSTENFKIATTRSTLFSSKCTASRLVAGLRPGPLGELTALHRLRSWLKLWPPGRERGKGRKVSGEWDGKGKRRRRVGKGWRRERVRERWGRRTVGEGKTRGW